MFDMKKTTLLMICMLATTGHAHAAKLITKTNNSANTTAAASAPAVAEPQPAKSNSSISNSPTFVAANEQPVVTRPATQATPAKAAATAIATGFFMGAQLGDSSVGAVMGYQFTKMFGMEISYDYFDPIYTRAVTTTIAEKNRLGASALWMFPVKFSEMGPMAIYVKVGYARTTEKVTTDDPGIPPSIPPSTFINTTTTTGVTGGAGIHVDVSQSATVRLGVHAVGSERTTYLAALYRF